MGVHLAGPSSRHIISYTEAFSHGLPDKMVLEMLPQRAQDTAGAAKRATDTVLSYSDPTITS